MKKLLALLVLLTFNTYAGLVSIKVDSFKETLEISGNATLASAKFFLHCGANGFTSRGLTKSSTTFSDYKKLNFSCQENSDLCILSLDNSFNFTRYIGRPFSSTHCNAWFKYQVKSKSSGKIYELDNFIHIYPVGNSTSKINDHFQLNRHGIHLSKVTHLGDDYELAVLYQNNNFQDILNKWTEKTSKHNSYQHYSDRDWEKLERK